MERVGSSKDFAQENHVLCYTDIHNCIFLVNVHAQHFQMHQVILLRKVLEHPQPSQTTLLEREHAVPDSANQRIWESEQKEDFRYLSCLSSFIIYYFLILTQKRY